MKTIFSVSLIALVAVFAVVPGFVDGSAHVKVPTTTIPKTITTTENLISAIQTVTDWIFVIFLLFSVVFVLLAAFQFVTGGGDPGAVGQARQKLIWAGVGIIVALFARAIPLVISNILQVNVGTVD